MKYDFLTATLNEVFSNIPDARTGGHGGGDYALMKSFVAAVANRDASFILSGPAESLETHLTVFAAERARQEQLVVQI